MWHSEDIFNLSEAIFKVYFKEVETSHNSIDNGPKHLRNKIGLNSVLGCMVRMGGFRPTFAVSFQVEGSLIEDFCLLFDSPPPFLERWAAYLCCAGRSEDKASRERTSFDSGAGILVCSMGFGCALSSLETSRVEIRCHHPITAWRKDITPSPLPREGTSSLPHCLKNRLHYAAIAWMRMESLHPKLSTRKTSSLMLSLLVITVTLWSLNRGVLLHVQQPREKQTHKKPRSLASAKLVLCCKLLHLGLFQATTLNIIE